MQEKMMAVAKIIEPFATADVGQHLAKGIPMAAAGYATSVAITTQLFTALAIKLGVNPVEVAREAMGVPASDGEVN